jgi:hypothetical protein
MLGRAMPRSYRKTMQNPFLFLNFSSNVKALCQIWTGRIGIVEAYCHILPYIAYEKPSFAALSAHVGKEFGSGLSPP